jgi:preprotein translocase subunit SecA
VMLRIIDQRWREHLEEMDYLQTGINLRAMGQKDPLVEWQREGFEMFGAMMTGIAQDFVKYVMHVQVVENQSGAPKSSDGRNAIADPADSNRDGVIDAGESGVSNLTMSSSDDVDTDGFGTAAATSGGGNDGNLAAVSPNTMTKQQTVVKDDFSKTPRNAPCPCGSGKKFKTCHGES